MIDEDEVGLKEKPEDTIYINKRHIGMIAPPLIIGFLATENWPKVKLGHVEVNSNINQIIHLAYRKSYLVIICPNSYEKLTQIEIISLVEVGSNILLKITHLVPRKSCLVITCPIHMGSWPKV